MAKRKRSAFSSRRTPRGVRSRSSNPATKRSKSRRFGSTRSSKTIPGVRTSSKFLQSARKFRVDEQHSAIGGQRLTLVVHPKPLRGKSLGTMHYTQQFRGLIGNSQFLYDATGPQIAGLQAVTTDVFMVNTISQFLASTGNGYESGQAFYELFSMNPNQNTTGGVLFPPVTDPANDRIAIKNVNIDMQLTNFTSAAVTVDLYFLQAKVHTTETPTEVWRSLLVREQMGTSDIGIPVASTGTRNDDAGAMIPEYFGASPEQVPAWSKFFKIMKKRVIQLAGGATQKVGVTVVVNHVFAKEEISELNIDAVEIMAKETVICMAIARGQVINDKTVTADLVTSFPTTAPVEVGLVGTMRWNLCGVKDSANRFTINQAAQNITAPTLGGTQMIDTEDAEINVIVLDQ